MDRSLPGSSVYGILQEKILEWVAISFSRESSCSGSEPWSTVLQAVSCTAGGFFTDWAIRDLPITLVHSFNRLLCSMSEKAITTHSSTLAWKIPWMEEPGGLQSMGSPRVGQDWTTSLSLFTFVHGRRKWQPTPVFLPGESQGRQSLVGCRLWVAQSRTRLKWLSSSTAVCKRMRQIYTYRHGKILRHSKWIQQLKWYIK